MTRKPNESAQEWYERATREHAEAETDLAGHRKRLGLADARSTATDEPYPLVHDDEYDAAHERASMTKAKMMAARRLAELEAQKPPPAPDPESPAD